MRDLETEGAMHADVDVKTAIERGIIPGPRMFVATRAFSGTGMHPLSGYSWELKVPEGVQIVDGADNIRHAVREQVKYGADWIKVYADRRYYLTPEGKLKSWANYTDEEFKAFVDEAHRLGRKTAAHAIGWDGIDAALRAGFDTIEHGDGLTPELIDRMLACDGPRSKSTGTSPQRKRLASRPKRANSSRVHSFARWHRVEPVWADLAQLLQPPTRGCFPCPRSGVARSQLDPPGPRWDALRAAGTRGRPGRRARPLSLELASSAIRCVRSRPP
jgi:imidazolonepropionase-like amidohydrolase